MEAIEKMQMWLIIKGKKQGYVSEKMGYRDNYLSRLIIGQRKLKEEHIKRFCEAIGISREEFEDVNGASKDAIKVSNTALNSNQVTQTNTIQANTIQTNDSLKDDMIMLLKEKIKFLEEKLEDLKNGKG